MLVDVTKEERDVLLRWKKRSDSFVLVRLKAEAVLYASRGADVSIIAEMVDRSRRTVRDWLASQRPAGLRSVVTGHAGNENAAKLTRAQKEQLKETLSRPPSQSGIKADFWDVPALRDVVKIKFGVERASDSSYQLLMRFPGMSFKLPDPFDKRRDEAAITDRRPRSARRSPNCRPGDGRRAPSTRSASSTRPKPDACGCPGAREPDSMSTAPDPPDHSSAP